MGRRGGYGDGEAVRGAVMGMGGSWGAVGVGGSYGGGGQLGGWGGRGGAVIGMGCGYGGR